MWSTHSSVYNQREGENDGVQAVQILIRRARFVLKVSRIKRRSSFNTFLKFVFKLGC